MALLSGLEGRIVGTRRIAFNTAAPIGARVVDAAFALIYLRLLGRTDVGAYTFLVVFTTYLDTLIDFGLNAVLAREVARKNINARIALRTVCALRFALWLIGLPLVVIVYGPGRDLANLSSEAATAGWIFYAGLAPTVIAKSASGVLWAAERLEYTAAVSVLGTLLRVVLGAIVLFSGFGLIGLAAVSAVNNVVSASVLYVLQSRVHLPEAAHGSVRWIRESWPLFLNQLLQGLFFKIDALLLPGLGGLAAAGAYGAAYRVSEGAGIISSSFTLALFPRLSRTADLAEAYRLGLRMLLQIALPLTAGVALLSAPIVAIVGGQQYLPDSATALAILICYLPLSYANGLTQYVLIAAGRQRLLTVAFVAVFIFNVAGNVLLIPRYTFVGAALVTVLSEVVLLVPFRHAVRAIAPHVSLMAEARAPLIATILMAPVAWWLRDAIHPIAAIIAGAAVYAAALYSTGGIDTRQQQVLRSLVRSRA
ncbi:MAG: flippase [Chloroflexi bacterium]|nr:flippase [Chloroflexota bacterium]